MNEVGNVWTRRGFVKALSALSITGNSIIKINAADSNKESWGKGSGNELAERGDQNYEPWRQSAAWQARVLPRFPDILVRPDEVRSIPDILENSSRRGKVISIKSGGHNVSEAFLRDGSVLLDLGELQDIDVDPVSQTAWIQPAAWSYSLVNVLARHGFAFPVSHCASVPMGGYLLGGGIGYNHDNWGTVASDLVLAVEVVLADGQTVVATRDKHSDLFWAARGAGIGFFGVITRFKIRLVPAPQTVIESSYVFPLSELANATTMLQDWVSLSPPNTELMMLLAHDPTIDKAARGIETKMCVVRAVAFADEQAARATLNSLANHPAIKHAVFDNRNVTTSLESMQIASVDPGMGLGYGRYAVDTIWTDKLPQVMNMILNHFSNTNSARTHIVVSPKQNRELSSDSSFSMVGNAFVGVYAVWDDPLEDTSTDKWMDGVQKLIHPLSVGQYINEVDAFKNPESVQNCFTLEAWKKLRALKKIYDPNKLFADYPGIIG